MNTTAALPARQPDRRMIRTKEAIRGALLRLLSQKDASRINVSELTEAAEISRKTFYLHYASVDDALAELESEIEQQVISGLRSGDLWTEGDSLYAILSRVDESLRKNRDYALYLQNCSSRFFILYRLKDAVKETVLEMKREQSPEDDPDWSVAADFAVTGIVSMYYEWIKAQTLTLQQLAEKAEWLLAGGMKCLLGKKSDKKE